MKREFCGNERIFAENSILRSSLSKRRCDERVETERIDRLLDAGDLLKQWCHGTGFTETSQGSGRSDDQWRVELSGCARVGLLWASFRAFLRFIMGPGVFAWPEPSALRVAGQRRAKGGKSKR